MTRIYRSFRRNDDRYFRTRNLHLAVILFAQGFELVNVDRDNPRNCQFVFRNAYDLEETVERFTAKRPLFVDAHKLIASWKLLRDKMHGQF